MYKKSVIGEIKLPEWHGKCAEVLNISDWLKSIDPTGKMTILEARKAFDGVVSNAKQIGNFKGGLNHLEYKKACNSCNPLLKYFNIIEIKTK